MLYNKFESYFYCKFFLNKNIDVSMLQLAIGILYYKSSGCSFNELDMSIESK